MNSRAPTVQIRPQMRWLGFLTGFHDRTFLRFVHRRQQKDCLGLNRFRFQVVWFPRAVDDEIRHMNELTRSEKVKRTCFKSVMEVSSAASSSQKILL